MITEKQFHQECDAAFQEVSKNIKNINRYKFYIGVFPDFDNERLGIKMDYCNKFNIFKRIWLWYNNYVPYLI